VQSLGISEQSFFDNRTPALALRDVDPMHQNATGCSAQKNRANDQTGKPMSVQELREERFRRLQVLLHRRQCISAATVPIAGR
jgi:hypothetical protein